MAILKDNAQVLHVYEQGNSSLVAVMFGRRLGQFRMHAKGIRRWPKKGFEGGLDLLVRGEVLVYPRSTEALWIFKEWDERARPVTGRSLNALRAASYLCELTEVLTRQMAASVADDAADSSADGQGQLYDLLAAAADQVEHTYHLGALLSCFTLHALRIEGLLPELNRCATCRAPLLPGSPAPAPSRAPGPENRAQNRRKMRRVWLTGEGLRCEECVRRRMEQIEAPQFERGVWLSPEALRVLLHLYSSPRPVGVSQNAARELAHALVLLVQGALEQDLRTLRAAARLVFAMSEKYT